MLKASPWKGVVRSGKRGKLNPRYIRPFKCYADEPLEVPLDGLHFDDKLQFVEEPVKIMDREVKQLRQSRVPIFKVRWTSKRGPEFTWEREDQFRKKYPHLFTKVAPSSSSATFFVRWIKDYPLPDCLKMPTHIGSVHGLKTRSLVEFLSTNLPTTYKAPMEKTYTWREAKEVVTNGAVVEYREGFDRPVRNTSWGNLRNRNKSRDSQIEEAYRSGKLAQLVKGIRKGKAKAFDTQQGDWKKDDKDNNVVKAPIIMIRQNDPKRKFAKQEVHSMGEITFPLVIDKAPSTAPVVIKVLVLKRQRVDLKIPLIGFSKEHSWPLVEVPLEITIGEGARSRTETLKFVILNKRLQDLLRTNADFFTWTYVDMKGVPKTLMIDGKPFNTEHKLEPIKQKQRGLAPKRNVTACKEVEELTEVGILREVKYQTWVTNHVMVNKSDGRWRMCVDFIDINKSCPKDSYPMLEIDWNVQSLSGFRLKCFLDAHKGYHQIQMAEKDEEKTSFYTIKGVYCYKKMPFGLKNAGATYQRRDSSWDILSPRKESKLTIQRFLSKGADKSLPFLRHSKATETRRPSNRSRKPKKHSKCYWPKGERDKCISTLLVDFLAETSSSTSGEKDKETKLVLISPEGKEYTYSLRFEFKATNNEAEYEALLACLRIAKEMEVRDLLILVDSQLVANQVKGSFEARQLVIKQYLDKAKEMLEIFDTYSMEQVRRNQNKKGQSNLRASSEKYMKVLVGFMQGLDQFSKDAKAGHDFRYISVAFLPMRYRHRRFEVPHIIISDNGKQFAEGTFPVFYKGLKIQQSLTSDYHPQRNGQVEVTNKDIIKGIERRLGQSHHETERVEIFEASKNDERIKENLYLLEQRREIASIREAIHKQKIKRYYNKRVRPLTFKPGEYVLRLNSASKDEYQGKIGPTWEGQYIIVEAYSNGAYKLKTLDG
ncbi:reverse transcriptase domain-containing protein [Tanacetum coccineum]